MASVFEELAAGGSQIFYSTHSPTFVNVARADRIVLVERCDDEEEDICTQVNTTTAEELLRSRRRLHPEMRMSVTSLQERYRMLCAPEHADAYFARVVVIVEGPTEAAALPIFAQGLGVDIDALGISIVPARGKTSVDAFYQLYQTHKIAVFAVFDSDTHKNDADRAWNRVLTRMLGLEETDTPPAGTGRTHAILDGDYERAMRQAVNLASPGLYEQLRAGAAELLGDSKPLVARYMASELVRQGIIPDFIREIIRGVRQLASPAPAGLEPDEPAPESPRAASGSREAAAVDDLISNVFS
ncbi:ATP-dependent nuclease [Microvirga sp. Mcv34]|uniref:ATP-dependent nuclease n=1 Tax=Microvirga sp. Mcv34 TaxID=2926016 RepID=UPI0021C7E985|nr:TOPRIM nucleotidyl transferase/hydrolase domain-containing protein [Microvirga sp. Mcv34]